MDTIAGDFGGKRPFESFINLFPLLLFDRKREQPNPPLLTTPPSPLLRRFSTFAEWKDADEVHEEDGHELLVEDDDSECSDGETGRFLCGLTSSSSAPRKGRGLNANDESLPLSLKE